MPFDWYTFNIGDFLPWLGSVIQGLYYVWQALWTELRYLPNVGTTRWPSWLADAWELLFEDLIPSLGNLTPVEFLLGSYLVVIVSFSLVRAISSLIKK